jgi:hypothetical protein
MAALSERREDEILPYWFLFTPPNHIPLAISTKTLTSSPCVRTCLISFSDVACWAMLSHKKSTEREFQNMSQQPRHATI